VYMCEGVLGREGVGCILKMEMEVRQGSDDVAQGNLLWRHNRDQRFGR